jgi:hypothetical protein
MRRRGGQYLGTGSRGERAISVSYVRIRCTIHIHMILFCLFFKRVLDAVCQVQRALYGAAILQILVGS